jgi:hypothetical protein
MQDRLICEALKPKKLHNAILFLDNSLKIEINADEK